jgi:hypothetical protein
MANIYKLSLIFRFQAEPGAPGVIVGGRIGGWTENFWFPSLLPNAAIAVVAVKRAALLCPDCAVIGWRQTPYTYTNNKLLPGKSTVGTFFSAGKQAGTTNSPEDTMRCQAVATNPPVSWNMNLHAIPDDLIESAQFLQNNNFQIPFANWVTTLLGQTANVPQAYWLGRDPTQQAQRVLTVNGNASTLSCATVANVVPGVSYLRLRRVYDDNGNPIKGSFFVTAAAAPVLGITTYTLAGLPGLNRTTPSGTCRLDLIATGPMTGLSYRSLSERKIGRPTLLYRGRRARSRV